MIVYRSQGVDAAAGARLAELRRRAGALPSAPRPSPRDYDLLLEFLIDLGELEAGVADALAPERDELHPLQDALRRASVAAAHGFLAACGPAPAASGWTRRLERALAEAAAHEPPARISLRVPEGYAHYGLYPETYRDAALDFAAACRPARVVCLGLRSIGTSLSAVVTAALEARGVPVESFTLRPRGHPFRRRPVLAGDLTRALWAGAEEAHYLVVDEGPGLSGSSLCGTAELLSRLGVPDGRIAFLPSWIPEAEALRSGEARERWARHRKFVGDFERSWVASGRLAAAFSARSLEDLGAGRWRALHYTDPGSIPAVHPQHERRKFLARGSWQGGGARMLKFVGLGRYGRIRRDRADRLAGAGFAPAVVDSAHGFLSTTFLRVRPLAPSDADEGFLERVAEYVAYVGRSFPAADATGAEALAEMTLHNTREGCGEDLAERLGRVIRAQLGRAERLVVADGRMQPHEWLRAPAGVLKTDGLDHGDDHFLPGPVDVAWDLAGAAVEFGLDDAATGFLVERYRAMSGDRAVEERLPAYRVAYLAFRLGYTRLGAEGLGADPDGARLARLAEHYRDRLRCAVEGLETCTAR